MAATVVLLGSTFNVTSGTHTVTATPNEEDLIVIVTASSGNTSTAVPTDNNGLSSVPYVLITSALKNSSADVLCIFVRHAFTQTASSTVFTHAPGASTGGGLAVYAVRGLAKSDLGAIRQSITQANQAAGTPAPTFANAVVTGNPVISAVFNATNPGGVTARSSPAYTRDVNTGWATPGGVDTMSINSGETATAITWGGASASAFSSIAIELDTTVTKLERQQDTFPGATLDTTKWYDNTQTGGTQSVLNNALTLTSPAATGNALAEVESLYFYDLTGSYAFVNAVVTQVADVNAEAALIVYHDENGNQLQITLITNTLQASYLIAGSGTNVGSGLTYNAAAMAWWRIRESGGSVFFDYSANSVNWTNMGSTANSNITWGITLVRASMATYDGDSNTTAEVGVFRNFNTIVQPVPIITDSRLSQPSVTTNITMF